MRKNGKAYRKLYLSYVCIFYIPIIMGVLFYSYAYSDAKKHADISNESLIRTVKNTCDRELEYYENELIQLALDENIQQLSAVCGNFGAENSYQLYQLQNELSDLSLSMNKNSDFSRDIMVYFENSDKVVSSHGNMDFNMYCELYCFGEDNASEEMLKTYLSEYHFRDFIMMDTKWTKGRPTLLLTMTNLKGELGESSAMIGLWLDPAVFSNLIEMDSWEQGLDWVIVDREDRIINCPEKYAGLEINYDVLGQGEEQKTVWNKEEYIMRTVLSTVFDWKYVLLMPERMLSKSAGRMRNIFLAGIFACLLLGFLAASRMMKINYKPLKALLDVFRKEEEATDVDNEYLYLKEKTVSLLEERSDFEQVASRSREIVKHYYFGDLMLNTYAEGSKSPDREIICRDFLEGKNLVLLFMVREAEKQEDDLEEYIQKKSMRRFIIENVLGEGLSREFRLEKVELGDMVAVAMNIRDKTMAYERRIADIVYSMQNFIYENYNFRVVALAGEAHKGLEGIHKSYMEAKEAEEFVAALDPDFISYREVHDRAHKKYAYSAEQEERIIAAVKNHNSQLAISYINKILDVNFLEIKASPEMLKRLLYVMMGTVIKAAQVVGETSDDLGMNDISMKLSLESIKEKFAASVENLCRISEMQSLECGQNQQLCQKIREYIQANFNNPDLNISQTGLHFHMTPAYLSSIYKKGTGESLLKFINQTRIDEAERLLSEGVSVVEAAERAGFRDSSTFIRIFKKYTGVTPGQLKNGR